MGGRLKRRKVSTLTRTQLRLALHGVTEERRLYLTHHFCVLDSLEPPRSRKARRPATNPRCPTPSTTPWVSHPEACSGMHGVRPAPPFFYHRRPGPFWPIDIPSASQTRTRKQMNLVGLPCSSFARPTRSRCRPVVLVVVFIKSGTWRWARIQEIAWSCALNFCFQHYPLPVMWHDMQVETNR